MDGTSHPATVALAAAIADAAKLLRVPIDGITVESLEARDWPDSCLGLPQEDEGCTDAVTPGYLVILGDGFRYRTDTQGNVRRETNLVDHELVVRFIQSGGLGGWTSEYHVNDSSLTAEDAARIRQFIQESDFFHLPEQVGNGDPITDLYNYELFVAHGRRNHTVNTYDGTGPHENPGLAEFISWLTERAPQPGANPEAS